MQNPLTGIALTLSACLLTACLSVKHEVRMTPAAGVSDTRIVYLVRRKWHIDVGFAAADLGAPLESLGARFPGATYVFFGFGDRRYLLAKHRNAPVLLGALWPGPGLVLMTAIEGSPQAAFGASQVIEFQVPSKDVVAAQTFVRASIASTDSTPGPYEDSLYFGALARYSALHTCNTWAAETLKSAGLPFRSQGVLFAGQLWASALKFASRENAAGIPAPVISAP